MELPKTASFRLQQMTSCMVVANHDDSWKLWHKSTSRLKALLCPWGDLECVFFLLWVPQQQMEVVDLQIDPSILSMSTFALNSWITTTTRCIGGLPDIASALPWLFTGLHSTWKSNCWRKNIHLVRCPPASFTPFNDISGLWSVISLNGKPWM